MSSVCVSKFVVSNNGVCLHVDFMLISVTVSACIDGGVAAQRCTFAHQLVPAKQQSCANAALSITCVWTLPTLLHHQGSDTNQGISGALQVAYGPDGSPSKALLGFCKKNGIQADAVFNEADPKGTEYAWAVIKQPGQDAAKVSSRKNPPIQSQVESHISLQHLQQ